MLENLSSQHSSQRFYFVDSFASYVDGLNDFLRQMHLLKACEISHLKDTKTNIY